jgi:Tfp pilus assembly protein PilP
VSQALLLASLLFLAACKDSASQQAQELDQTQRSWEATVRLTTMLRQRGAVPAEYARQTLDAAREELEKTRRKAQQVSR